MKTNLSSQISLNRVSPRYYRPENAFEKSVLTRLEKLPTDIYESIEDGANKIDIGFASREFKDDEDVSTALLSGVYSKDAVVVVVNKDNDLLEDLNANQLVEIGRASCRERV